MVGMEGEGLRDENGKESNKFYFQITSFFGEICFYTM